MSRQLNRIRSLVTEIDEIQRAGQGRAVPTLVTATETHSPGPVTLEPSVLPGRVVLSLRENVVIELQVEDQSKAVGEIVELRSTKAGIEILFSDGKAFHIPFKPVQ